MSLVERAVEAPDVRVVIVFALVVFAASGLGSIAAAQAGSGPEDLLSRSIESGPAIDFAPTTGFGTDPVATWAPDRFSFRTQSNPPGPLAGEFSPPHFDTGFDSNGNGLYDFLVVNASVMVDTADLYGVGGGLHDPTYGLALFNTTSIFLDPGIWIVSIFYSGGAINASGIDGPYTVDLFLVDSSSNLLDTDSHTTQAYDHTDFDPPQAEFAPPHSDSAFDSDGDGLYNVLSVDVNLTVNRAGRYGVLGLLHDATSALWSSAGWATLDPGPQTVSVPFPGYAIRASGIDGPYIVELSLVEFPSFQFLGSDRHTTGEWSHLEFEEMPSIPSAFTESAPTIDGAIGPDEWASAYSEDLGALPGNLVPGSLYVMNDNDFLYIAYDAVGDTTMDGFDAASLAFDTDNDGIATNGREDQFVQGGWAPNNQGHFVYDSSFRSWTLEDSPFNPDLPDHAGLAGAWGFGPSAAAPTDHRIYEFQIPLVLLGARPGDTLGLFGGSQPAPGLFDNATFGWSTWPAYTLGAIPLGVYGDLTLSSTDLVAPTISITEPSPGTLLAVDAVTVVWTASDAESGLDRFEVRVDDKAPVVLPGSAESYLVEDLADGSHTIEVIAYDQAGNDAAESVTVTVDTAPPSVEISAPEEAQVIGSSVIVVTWSASDVTSGVANFEVRLDDGAPTTLDGSATSHTLTELSDGGHVVDVSAFDHAGHSAHASVAFTVDTTPPDVTITAPVTDLSAAATIEVTWSVDESGSGLDRIEVSLDDGSPTVLPGSATALTLSDLTDGDHSIRVEAFDVAGHAESDSVSVTVDTTAPTVSIVSPAPDTIEATSAITLTWSASDATSGVERVEVRADDGPTVTLPAGTAGHEFHGLSDGEHVLTVTAFDRAGHSQFASVTVTVDMTQPTLSVSAPSAGAVLGTDDIAVAWTAADAGTGIAELELSLDDGPIVRPEGVSSYTFQDVSDGLHTIRLTALDAAGNAFSVTLTVTVDTVGPTLTINSPGPGAVIVSSVTTISFTVDDATSGVDRIEVRVDDGEPATLSRSATSHAITGLADGIHTVRVTAFDRAGNSEFREVTFRVDTSFLSPSGPYGYLGITSLLVVIGAAIAGVLVAWRVRRKSRPPEGP